MARWVPVCFMHVNVSKGRKPQYALHKHLGRALERYARARLTRTLKKTAAAATKPMPAHIHLSLVLNVWSSSSWVPTGCVVCPGVVCCQRAALAQSWQVPPHYRHH